MSVFIPPHLQPTSENQYITRVVYNAASGTWHWVTSRVNDH